MKKILERTPCFTDPESPPTKMPDFFSPIVIAGVRSLMYQRDILFEWLKMTEGMRAFISHRMSTAEEFHAKLEKAREKKEAARDEVERLRRESKEAEHLRKEREAVEAKCQESEENARLRKEIDELRSGLAAQKELEEEYQKQVDEMYFVGYRCCMKKNDITRDTPSFSSDDEDDALDGSS
ncbi:hypothetical protein PVL29_020517 [Vitis rotundifolia]|uniref:Uncharacterized protein n=1 Tax=Vitis rotundifolia TaxID=103349 RepID=A0AA39DAZ7_VITRO|nr:hypothetical protein PVL29_020517 [Vitis rotundifolia]